MSAPVPVDRKGFIGGSDLAKIINVSPWGDAFSLYLEKRGEVEVSQEETRVQRRGKILEGPIGELHAAENGADVRPGATIALPGFPHFRSQIDRFEHDHGVVIPLEIKSASEFTRGKWGPSGTDDAPTYYCAQMHWQLMATGAPFGRIVALLGSDDLRVYTIERDETVAKFLLESAVEFWQRVQSGNPPALNVDHPSAADTLARLFRNPNATEILQADDQLRAWRDVMVEASAQMKTYEGVRDGAKLHLLAAMRSAGIIDFGDGQMFERKFVKRKGYVVADTTYIDSRLKKTTGTKTAGEYSAPALTQGAAA